MPTCASPARTKICASSPVKLGRTPSRRAERPPRGPAIFDDSRASGSRDCGPRSRRRCARCATIGDFPDAAHGQAADADHRGRKRCAARASLPRDVRTMAGAPNTRQAASAWRAPAEFAADRAHRSSCSGPDFLRDAVDHAALGHRQIPRALRPALARIVQQSRDRAGQFIRALDPFQRAGRVKFLARWPRNFPCADPTITGLREIRRLQNVVASARAPAFRP